MCYTRNAAASLHAEGDRGVLEKGKAADLVVVQGDWKKPGGLAGTKVLATCADGAWVHQTRRLKMRR
jgi:predicted amidohydrolase YtcJ